MQIPEAICSMEADYDEHTPFHLPLSSLGQESRHKDQLVQHWPKVGCYTITYKLVRSKTRQSQLSLDGTQLVLAPLTVLAQGGTRSASSISFSCQ